MDSRKFITSIIYIYNIFPHDVKARHRSRVMQRITGKKPLKVPTGRDCHPSGARSRPALTLPTGDPASCHVLAYASIPQRNRPIPGDLGRHVGKAGDEPKHHWPFPTRRGRSRGQRSLRFQLRVRDGKAEDVRLDGQGCATPTAATSPLSDFTEAGAGGSLLSAAAESIRELGRWRARGYSV